MIGDRAALPAMAQSLREDTCPWVRSQVARALGGLGHVAIDTLRTTLREDPSGVVRAAAALALGGIADPKAVVDLVDVVRDEGAPAEVRAGAALGLGRHFRRHDPRLPALRFQHNYTLLPALVAWAFQQEL
jgi:HEAT repeat protein